MAHISTSSEVAMVRIRRKSRSLVSGVGFTIEVAAGSPCIADAPRSNQAPWLTVDGVGREANSA